MVTNEAYAAAVAQQSELAAQLAQTNQRNEQMVAALRKIADADMGEDGSYYTNRENIRIARAALAEAEA